MSLKSNWLKQVKTDRADAGIKGTSPAALISGLPLLSL
jgi:hypothetical protein